MASSYSEVRGAHFWGREGGWLSLNIEAACLLLLINGRRKDLHHDQA